MEFHNSFKSYRMFRPQKTQKAKEIVRLLTFYIFFLFQILQKTGKMYPHSGIVLVLTFSSSRRTRRPRGLSKPDKPQLQEWLPMLVHLLHHPFAEIEKNGIRKVINILIIKGILRTLVFIIMICKTYSRKLEETVN